MLSTIKQSTTFSCSSSDLLLFPTTNNRSPSKLVNSSSSSLTFSSSKRPKPLYLSSSSSYGGVSSSKCKAYEAADESIIIDDDAVAKAEAEAGAQRLKISIYFATWWGLNVVFNIYNKVLNAFPYPWLTSTLSLAAGSLIMLFS